MSTEERELNLVEKVDFRILSVSNNEEKLQQLLTTYLPPLLLKAGSEHASVRNKVDLSTLEVPFIPIANSANRSWQYAKDLESSSSLPGKET
jgi:hypothetical protein